MFYGFRDQTSSFKGKKHLLGLLSYDHRIVVHTNPTNNFDVYEDAIDGMECGGSTAIYEAISAGCNMLAAFKTLHPNADLRVVCLSDGNNNSNKVTAPGALDALTQIGAVCDCIIVGNSPDADLLKLVTATEGSCFQITSLSEGYECLESQAVVSLLARRDGAPKPEPKKRSCSFENISQASLRKGAFIVPTASTVKNPIPIQQALGGVAKMSGSASQKRIMKELKDFNTNSSQAMLEHFEVFPDVDVIGHVQSLKILMNGRTGTPYEKGCFELLYQFPGDYPFKPPLVKVVTPIYHYAVSTQGGLCLDVLRDAWSPAFNLSKVLKSLGDLLMDSDNVDPSCNFSVRSWLSELKRVNPKEYHENAVKFTHEHC